MELGFEAGRRTQRRFSPFSIATLPHDAPLLGPNDTGMATETSNQ